MNQDFYFYRQEADSYSFIRVPYALVQDYKEIDPAAKLLYGVLLSRMALSRKNKWMDGSDRVFIFYPIEEICQTLCCKRDKAMKLLRQLEQADLISRTHQGVGRADRIYVKKFIRVEKNRPQGSIKSTPGVGNPDTS